MVCSEPGDRGGPDGVLGDEPVNGSGQGHLPVLVEPVLELLDPRPGQCLVDCTIGPGGHAKILAERLGSEGRLIGIDLDEGNVVLARKGLADAPAQCQVLQGNFAELDAILRGCEVARVDRILADLGLSSNQLDDPARGFSFLGDGSLDMRMDRREALSAVEVVNRSTERELADLIYQNSQERFSRRIAKRICQARRAGRIRSTRRLAEVVASAVQVDPGSRKSKIHPATRTFLALRIAVNGELENLRSLLREAPKWLAQGGRIGVISFHSVEDREVKLDFKRRAQQGLYSIVTKRPVIAGPAERADNPRSRSAKLRVAERTDRPLEACLETE